MNIRHASSTMKDMKENKRCFPLKKLLNELNMSLFCQESDLTFRLASGLVIWQPMWEHRQPDIPAFTALIKPVRNIVTGETPPPLISSRADKRFKACLFPN